MGGGGGGGKAPQTQQAAPAAPATEAVKTTATLADKNSGDAEAQAAKSRAAKLAQGIGETVLSTGTALGDSATAAPGVTTKSTVLG